MTWIRVALYERLSTLRECCFLANAGVQQGSIQLNSEKLTDPRGTLTLSPGDILKLDKKRMIRLV